MEKILSVFIDESGDFGPYEHHAPFYIVSMILHEQSIDIAENISISLLPVYQLALLCVMVIMHERALRKTSNNKLVL